jgi:hypothetical protein
MTIINIDDRDDDAHTGAHAMTTTHTRRRDDAREAINDDDVARQMIATVTRRIMTARLEPDTLARYVTMRDVADDVAFAIADTIARHVGYAIDDAMQAEHDRAAATSTRRWNA